MPTPRRLRGTVETLVRHTSDTFTVTVRLEKEGPKFRAGQFLHLALDRYDPTSQWPDSRVFSIANSPSQRDVVKVAYSVKGDFTSRMASDLRPGREVWVKLPYGAFYLDSQPEQETVLIAGGTGITPFVSFLELASEGGCAVSVRLFYGARTPELLLFRDTIDNCCKCVDSFTYSLFAESGHPDANVQTGRLDLARILGEVTSPRGAYYYLAGPPAMIENFSQGLLAERVPAEHIMVDRWE